LVNIPNNTQLAYGFYNLTVYYEQPAAKASIIIKHTSRECPYFLGYISTQQRIFPTKTQPTKYPK
jgi:hypothetical protein